MVSVLKWRWRSLILVAIALLFMGLTSCRIAAEPFKSSQKFQKSQVLQFIPKQSLVAAVVDTGATDSSWRRSDLLDGLSQAGGAVLAPLSLNFQGDIQPWLGNEIAVAVTDKDLDRDRRNGRQAGYLLAVDIADGERLREFLELFWQRQSVSGRSPILLEDSGVPIITGDVAQYNQPLATAVVGDNTLLVANDVRVLRQSLRVVQVQELQLPGADCCGVAWVNLRIPAFVDWLGVAAPQTLPLLSTFRWQQLQATLELKPQQLIIGTTFIEGMHRNTASQSVSQRTPPANKTGGIPSQYLPASVAWAATGQDLRPLWNEIQNELTHYQGLPSAIQRGQRWLSTPLAQSLVVPLTQLLADDYAVAQLDDGTWLMALPDSSPTAVKQLDSIAAEQGLTVSQLTLRGQGVTVWSQFKTRVDIRNRETTVETDLVGVHTNADDCHIFATSIAGLTAALDAPIHPLSENRRWQLAIESSQSGDTPHWGYIYGTWSELERLLASNRWFSLVKPMLQPWSQSIDAISINSHGQTANQSTGTISVLLKN